MVAQENKCAIGLHPLTMTEMLGFVFYLLYHNLKREKSWKARLLVP